MGNPKLDDWSHAVPGEPNALRRVGALSMIEAEVVRSYTLHGCPLWGRHEAVAIILEEFEEFKEAVFRDQPYLRVRKELIQLAAMCVRYLETEPALWPNEPKERKSNAQETS